MATEILIHQDNEGVQSIHSPQAGPSSSPSYSPERSPSLEPLPVPTALPPLSSSLLQSIYSSYPLPISLPFPPHQNDPQKRTVCKHWLRGLCKKSDATCDYLHEYDMRKMPECRMFATFGFCNNGEDCLYRHKLPKEKRRECADYRRGFCPRGPDCPQKHIRRIACPYYLAGFCPKGPECLQAHPKSTVPSTASRRTSPILSHKALTAEEAFGHREREDRGERGGGGGGGGAGIPRQMGGGRDDGAGGRPPRDGAGGGGAGGGAGRRDLSTTTCFKCGEMGHYANNCPNPNRPGDRGGLNRRGGTGRER